MISNSFKIHELVPKHIYEAYGEKAWRFISPQLILSIDMLKTRFPKGTMTINNYMWDGLREWSGLRTPTSPYYSETSMHSFGKAVDCIFSHYMVGEVRDYIIDNPTLFPHVIGLEMNVGWVHLDCRNEEVLRKFNA